MGLGGEGLSDTSFLLIGGVAAKGELRVGAEVNEAAGTESRGADGGRPIPREELDDAGMLGGGDADGPRGATVGGEVETDAGVSSNFVGEPSGVVVPSWAASVDGRGRSGVTGLAGSGLDAGTERRSASSSASNDIAPLPEVDEAFFVSAKRSADD